MAAATAQLASFETGHGDMVHDAAFDYYGKRLATCSSDRSIKLFNVVGEQVRGPAPRLEALPPAFRCQPPPPPLAFCASVMATRLCRIADHALGRPQRPRGAGVAGRLGAPQVWQPAGVVQL